MNQIVRLILILAVWIISAVLCMVFGFDHLWLAGLCVSAIALSTLAYANFISDVSRNDKRKYNVAGCIVLLFGLLLLYIGIFQS